MEEALNLTPFTRMQDSNVLDLATPSHWIPAWAGRTSPNIVAGLG